MSRQEVLAAYEIIKGQDSIVQQLLEEGKIARKPYILVGTRVQDDLNINESKNIAEDLLTKANQLIELATAYADNHGFDLYYTNEMGDSSTYFAHSNDWHESGWHSSSDLC